MKMPAFQFYPADWKKDPGVQSLSRHDRSVWFDMLLIMHESSERGVLLLAGKPMPEDALARVLNLDNQEVKQILSTLLTYGVASERQEDGAIISRRMVKDEELIQIRRKAGKKGGNPVLLKQIPTTPVKQNLTTPVKQIPTPSSSSSSSSSTTVIKEEAIASCPVSPNEKFPLKPIWDLVPQISRTRSSQKQVIAEWKKIKVENRPTIPALIAAIEAWCKTDKWAVDGCAEGLHLWINRRQWENVPTTEEEPEEPAGTRRVEIGGRVGHVIKFKEGMDLTNIFDHS